MNNKMFRRQYLVEPDLQFWFVLTLILIALFEGMFVGWGISRLMATASGFNKPHIVWDFFKALALVLFPLIAGNFVLGIYLSHKVAGPLYRIRKALDEIRKGNLDAVQLRPGDLLNSFVKDFNETVLVLRKLVMRDQKVAADSLQQIDQCITFIKQAFSAENSEELLRKLQLTRSFLVAINSHYRLSAQLSQKENKYEFTDGL